MNMQATQQPPRIQPNVTMTEPAFSAEECRAISAYTGNLRKAEVLDWNDGAVNVETRIRDGYADHLHHAPETAWIFEKLRHHITGINNRYYHFELTDLILQLARYEEGHFYDWHMDMIHEPDASRKLSLTVQLSDDASYQGGDVEFMLGTTRPTAPRTQGIIVFFPAYVLHRVRPVTRGTRLSLVGWSYGPHFR